MLFSGPIYRPDNGVYYCGWWTQVDTFFSALRCRIHISKTSLYFSQVETQLIFEPIRLQLQNEFSTGKVATNGPYGPFARTLRFENLFYCWRLISSKIMAFSWITYSNTWLALFWHFFSQVYVMTYLYVYYKILAKNIAFDESNFASFLLASCIFWFLDTLDWISLVNWSL